MDNEQTQNRCYSCDDLERKLYPFVKFNDGIRLDMGERSASPDGFLRVRYCPGCGKKIDVEKAKINGGEK